MADLPSRILNRRERLRVVFVTKRYPAPNLPRGSIFTHRAIKVLSSVMDVEVIDVCPWKRGQPFVTSREYDGIHVLSVACPPIPFWRAPRLDLLIQIYFGKHLAESCLRNADVIHGTQLYSDGLIAGYWAKKVGKPGTSHAIGSDVNFVLPQVLGSSFFRFPWHLKRIVCESADLMNKINSLVPGFQNSEVIYRGVDTEKFSPPGVNPTDKDNRGALRFLYLGGFHTWDADHPYYYIKGGPILLQAWQQIERQVAPDILIVGGPRVDVYRAQLEEWRTKLSRSDSVHLLPLLYPDSVPDVIRGSDVVIVPSMFEGLPNVVKEAQACGRPVLGTDAGGIPEAVLQNKTGIIVPRGDVDELAAGILWFHTNRNAIGSLGMNAREYMLQKFSWERFSKEMTDFFHQALQTSAVRSLSASGSSSK